MRIYKEQESNLILPEHDDDDDDDDERRFFLLNLFLSNSQLIVGNSCTYHAPSLIESEQKFAKYKFIESFMSV